MRAGTIKETRYLSYLHVHTNTKQTVGHNWDFWIQGCNLGRHSDSFFFFFFYKLLAVRWSPNIITTHQVLQRQIYTKWNACFPTFMPVAPRVDCWLLHFTGIDHLLTNHAPADLHHVTHSGTHSEFFPLCPINHSVRLQKSLFPDSSCLFLRPSPPFTPPLTL